MYIERQLEKKFIAVSEEYACVLLTGPRQVGKSTMLRHLMEGTARAEVSLDDLEERRLAKTDPAMFLKLHSAPVLIDEVQYAPELFSYIKIAVDNGAAPGSYWLTGSQAYRLMALAQESLAGRTAMYAPEDNYIYKYSEAAQMAAYGEYGFDIGSGGSFDLSKYYQMCDEIVDHLKAHPEFLRKHFDKLRSDDHCAEERSLHLLAFDLIYCCRTYGYYKEIPYVPKAKSPKRTKVIERQEADAAIRQARIADITAQIKDLRASLPDVSDISLVNVAVTSRLYGSGMVTEHNLNTIRVRFPGATKTFILDAKFPQRPTFENDADVVAAYTEYTSISGKIEKLEKQLKQLDG